MSKKSSKRFKIIEGTNGCFINDTKGVLSTLPLGFRYSDLSDGNKEKLQKWLALLNKK